KHVRWPRFSKIAAILSLLGAAFLCFIAGAAVMHFRLPPSSQLEKAFAGAQEWWQSRPQATPTDDLQDPRVVLRKPRSASPGLTLVTTTLAPEAMLLDLKGDVVHRWKMTTPPTWTPSEPGARAPRSGEKLHWEKCHLFPNGDLLALCSGSNGGSPYGYGL